MEPFWIQFLWGPPRRLRLWSHFAHMWAANTTWVVWTVSLSSSILTTCAPPQDGWGYVAIFQPVPALRISSEGHVYVAIVN